MGVAPSPWAEEGSGARDADQSASDTDQSASARDDADATSDQPAPAEDQAAPDQHPSLHADPAKRIARDRTRAARQEGRLRRLATQDARTTTERTRNGTAEQREATAAERDEVARRRDELAAERERSIDEAELSFAEKVEWLRRSAAQDRERAAADRERAAADRKRAARDRAQAARQRSRLEAELHSAHLDGLTGALRRETGMLSLSQEVERTRRGDGRFVIAFVDVDHMKEINDHYGHAEGDRVLQAVVAAMRADLRPYDPIVRYGGDEFVCGIGGSDLDDAARRFEGIDRAIHDDVDATISVGLAMLAMVETLDELIARADAALLEARGRRHR